MRLTTLQLSQRSGPTPVWRTPLTNIINSTSPHLTCSKRMPPKRTPPQDAALKTWLLAALDNAWVALPAHRPIRPRANQKAAGRTPTRGC